MKPGDVISERYRLLRLIDVGGMGEVWAARNELTQKSFAIKFLLPALVERRDSLERFVREAETAGSLDHPSIVNVFDVAQDEEGRPFIVMELLSGESLEARIEKGGPLSPLEAAAFISQIADGLAAAHAAGIVHRDLSAANIFLARSVDGGRPVPKILDFGVSKTLGPGATDRTLTANGAVLGCPEFMSPEQARGAEFVDSRTDLWALGTVLYVAVAGTRPFNAKNYNALMVQILTRSHRPILEVVPSLDPELAGIIESCLQKDRERRIQTARELSDKLSGIARRLAGPAAHVVSPRRRATDRLPREDGRAPLRGEDARAVKRLRPRSSLIGVVSAVAGLSLGVMLAALHFGRQAASAAPPPLPAPVRPSAAAVLPPLAPLEPESRAKPAAPRPPDDEHDLALAVARGLGVPKPTERR